MWTTEGPLRTTKQRMGSRTSGNTNHSTVRYLHLPDTHTESTHKGRDEGDFFLKLRCRLKNKIHIINDIKISCLVYITCYPTAQ